MKPHEYLGNQASGGTEGANGPVLQSDFWERWQKNVIQFLVLALKVISAGAIIAIFAIAEYAAVQKVASALLPESVHAAANSEPQCATGCCKQKKVEPRPR